MHVLFPGSFGDREERWPLGNPGVTLADLEEALGLTFLPTGDALAADLLDVWEPGEGVRNKVGAPIEADPELPVKAGDMMVGDTDPNGV